MVGDVDPSLLSLALDDPEERWARVGAEEADFLLMNADEQVRQCKYC